MPEFDILVAGEINPDLILTGNVKPEFNQVEKLVGTAALTIGSSSAIFACGAARLGLRVAFIGICGDDVFGHFMLDEMQNRNVDVSNVIIRPNGQTGLSVILNQSFGYAQDAVDRAILNQSFGCAQDAVDRAILNQSFGYAQDAVDRAILNQTLGYAQDAVDREILNQSFGYAQDAVDRAILTHLGLIADLQASDIPDSLLRQARHLHIASYFLQTKLQPDLPALFQRAHSLGLSTSLDTNYDPTEKWFGFDELLSVTDVFLPNKTEALAITKTGDVESASQTLADKCGLVAVKLGVDGALACKNKEIIQSPSISVDVVDTVGAGDTFDAGFLFGYLNQLPLEKSLRLACVCGALSTQKAGGTESQPTLEEALTYVP